jgi:hypothetical protein
MFRIDFLEEQNRATMRIAGHFAGQFADEARQQVLRRQIPSRLMVDVSEVTFVDAGGEEVLSWLGRLGAQFIAQNCYALYVCERLQLPIFSNGRIRRRRAPRQDAAREDALQKF